MEFLPDIVLGSTDCAGDCQATCCQEVTSDPTATPTATPTASPTVAPTDPAGPPKTKVKVRMNVGTNTRGQVKNPYYTLNPGNVQFLVDGSWTAAEELFALKTCVKNKGPICPPDFMEYGPFD